MNQDMEKLASACMAAADFYCTKPDAAGPQTVVDIYRVLATLAQSLAAHGLQPPVERVH